MLMPDRQTAEESTHTSSSSFTYRKKGGTSPPHPTPKELRFVYCPRGPLTQACKEKLCAPASEYGQVRLWWHRSERSGAAAEILKLLCPIAGSKAFSRGAGADLLIQTTLSWEGLSNQPPLSG